MTATYAQGVFYELVRSLFNEKISLISAELGEERAKKPQDAYKIDSLEQRMMELVVEREEISAEDEVAMEEALLKHCSKDGGVEAVMNHFRFLKSIG